MNGLVLEQLESIPDANVSFNINNFKFETVEINGTRVKKVEVTIMRTANKTDSV
jgi:Mg2+/Co2+ transporter CorB